MHPRINYGLGLHITEMKLTLESKNVNPFWITQAYCARLKHTHHALARSRKHLCKYTMQSRGAEIFEKKSCPGVSGPRLLKIKFFKLYEKSTQGIFLILLHEINEVIVTENLEVDFNNSYCKGVLVQKWLEMGKLFMFYTAWNFFGFFA